MKKDIKQLINYLSKTDLKNCCIKIFFNKNGTITRITSEKSVEIEEKE